MNKKKEKKTYVKTKFFKKDFNKCLKIKYWKVLKQIFVNCLDKLSNMDSGVYYIIMFSTYWHYYLAKMLKAFLKHIFYKNLQLYMTYTKYTNLLFTNKILGNSQKQWLYCIEEIMYKTNNINLVQENH